MKNIIVTVTDRQNRFMLDVEMPTELIGIKLAEDVMEVLNKCNLDVKLDPAYHCFFLNRPGRVMSDDETLAEAGVWNGDYITIMSRV